jgi:hypothetical protein
MRNAIPILAKQLDRISSSLKAGGRLRVQFGDFLTVSSSLPDLNPVLHLKYLPRAKPEVHLTFG